MLPDPSVLDNRMFALNKDESILTFTVARKGARFGEGTRIVFWIDRSQQILQRGRQESIPIDSIDGFGVDSEGRRLFCRMGPNEMILFDREESDRDNLQAAAYELANFCGVPLL